MRLNIFNSLMGLCVATAAVSCSDALVDNVDMRPVGGEASDMISFVVAENNNATRGGSLGNRPCGGTYLRTSNGTDSLYLNMEVADIDDDLYTRAEDISEANKPSRLNMTCRLRKSPTDYLYYFENVAFDNNGTVWTSDPAYYWLNSGEHFTFYGYYAPADAEGVIFKGNSDKDYIPTIDYTVPADVKKQFDLAYHLNTTDSELISTGYNKQVPLNIKHALSKIAFKTGDGMAEGTINSVSINNVCNKASLNLADGSWDFTGTADSRGDFTLAFAEPITASSNMDITPEGENKYFMLLPQENTAGAEIVVEFTPANGEKATYSAPLEKFEWVAGKKYIYTITIEPEIGMEIDLVPDTVDAHYVIAKAHINVDKIPEGKKWELTVSATGISDEDVSVVSELSSYQAEGYWIDKIIRVDGSTESARGSNSITGTSSQDIYIFVPENISPNENRTITLSLNIKGSIGNAIDEKNFEQYHPTWVGNYGWEQIDDNKSAQFGFNWTRLVYYGYLYSYTSQYDPRKSRMDKVCQSIIDENNAGGYANVDIYHRSFGDYRSCIVIDYKKLNDLGGNDQFDGLNNTKELFAKAGTSTTAEFEKIVATTLKTENGHTTEVAFRIGDNERGLTATTGDNYLETPAIGECLKKNKYQLKEIKTAEGDISYIPSISEIKWYLPAVNQFPSNENTIQNIKDRINPTLYWSSTTAANDQTQAYGGDNKLYPRINIRKVRACRNKE